MNDIEKLYALFGCDENVTDEELYAKYLELRTKYQNDRFLEGEAGNEAAEKLTELVSAYNDLTEYRKNKNAAASESNGSFAEVDSLIKAGKIDEAQAALDKFDERNAEWHYLQSVIFYKKNWANESKRQLEIAISMDGSVEKYKTAYDKLCKQINYNEDAKKGKPEYDKSGSGRFNEPSYEEPADMMGGDSCMEFCCRSMVCSALLNCCCCPSIR